MRVFFLGLVIFLVVVSIYMWERMDKDNSRKGEDIKLNVSNKNESRVEFLPVYIERVWACDRIYALIKEANNQSIDYKNDSYCKLIWVHKTELGAYSVPPEMVNDNLKKYTEWEKTNETIPIKIYET